MSIDHGELNIPGRLKNLDAEIVRNVERQRREAQDEARERRKAAREAEAERVWFTREQIKGARAVRLVGLGWQRVIRVNARSVTIPGVLDPIRVPFKQVLEVKR